MSTDVLIVEGDNTLVVSTDVPDIIEVPTETIILSPVDSPIEILELPSSVEILDIPPVVEILELPPIIEILEVGVQGPPGPPGQSGVGYVTYLAQGPLGGHRAVCAAFSLYVRYADHNSLPDATAVIGITLNAAADNDLINVATSGEIIEPSWSWAEGLPIFVGANGALTQVPPTSGFQLIVGVATSPTSILVGIKQPIIL